MSFLPKKVEVVTKGKREIPFNIPPGLALEIGSTEAFQMASSILLNLPFDLI